MAGGKRNTPDGPGGRRRRTAPTIDLTASEIVEPAKAEAAPPPNPDQPQEDPVAQTSHGPAESRPEAQFEARRDGARQGVSWLPPGSLAPLIAAATAACAVVVVLLLALWIAGSIRGRDDGSVALALRLSQTEQQLRELATRTALAATDPKALDEVSTRLARIEGAITTRVAAVESAAKSATESAAGTGRRIDELANSIREMRSQSEATARRIEEMANAVRDARGQAETVNRRMDELGTLARDARSQADTATATAARNQPETSRADLEKLSTRIATLEQTAKTVQSEVAKRGVTSANDDRASRLAIIATSLRSVVERGEPFANELAAAKQIAPDAKVLAPLETFASSGVPSTLVLSRELTTIVPMLVRAAIATGPEGGFMVKLQANAERLVRIRPVGDNAGDDAASTIARAEARAAQNDVPGALAELVKLPADVRVPAEDWIRKAQAGNAAVEASKKFAADWLTALGKSGL